VAELVIATALLGVTKHRVGFGRFLETLFGLMIVRIAVGMVFQRQLPIGARCPVRRFRSTARIS
jgi:hypothetical protein